jgi:hypothetical protein
MKIDPPMSKREKQALWIFIFAIVFYVAQNQYFGWNNKPSNAVEGVCDVAVIALWFLSFLWKPSRVKNVTINRIYKFSRVDDGDMITELEKESVE